MPDDGLEYHAPESLDEAVALLERCGPRAALLGGGTDVVAALKHGVLAKDHLVSLKRIRDHRDIAASESGDLLIGAFTPLDSIASSAAVHERCHALAEAAGKAVSPLLRGRATLGGNLCLDTRCWYYNQTESWRASRPLCLKAGGAQCWVNEKRNTCVALFCAETPPALMVAGARVILRGPAGERTIGVHELYSDDGLAPLKREATEIVTTVVIPPPPPRWGSTYLKYAARGSIDFPLLGIAAGIRLEPDGRIAEARIAVTGAKSAPFRLTQFETELRGRAVPNDAERGESVARSLGTLYLSDDVPYKRRLAGLLAAEAVRRAAEFARGSA